MGFQQGSVITRVLAEGISLDYLGQLWEQFLVFLNGQPQGRIYIFLFLGAFMENVVPPIPGDTLIVFGAYLSGIGIIRVVPAYLWMWAGSALGCMLVYGVAYLKGRELFLRWESRKFSDENLNRAERWFSRYGNHVVVFNRFLPTVRVFVGVVAGLSRMHPLRMLAYVLLGTFLWNSLLVYFGLMVGENWRLVVDVLRAYNRIILVLIVMGGIGFLLWRRKKKQERAQAAESQDEATDSGDKFF